MTGRMAIPQAAKEPLLQRDREMAAMLLPRRIQQMEPVLHPQRISEVRKKALLTRGRQGRYNL